MGRGSCKYIGTAVGIADCVSGMPCHTNHIVKYDPMNDITAFLREGAGDSFSCRGDGVLGRDSCIYVFERGLRVLKIDATNGSHHFEGNNIKSSVFFGDDWGDAILGIDECIYSIGHR